MIRIVVMLRKQTGILVTPETMYTNLIQYLHKSNIVIMTSRTLK